MGHYTNYDLTIIAGDDNFTDYRTEIQELTGEPCFQENCKWYNHELDMINYSLKYPKVVFQLDGESSESGDLWRIYFKNGMREVVQPKIIYPDFDEKKLTNYVTE